MPNFDLPVAPIPIDRAAPVAVVYRYWPDADEGERYELLPHVRLLEITETGDETQWTARFRYAFDDEVLQVFFPGAPRRVEEVFALDRGSWWQVTPNDRLVARVYNPNVPDDPGVLAFDGYPRFPQADLGGETEVVTFEAVFHPSVLWDTPIEYGVYRDLAKYQTPGESVPVYGSESCRFNPEGRGNCLRDVDDGDPPEEEEAETVQAHPVFMDHRVPDLYKSKWTLEKAVRYLIYEHNKDEAAAVNPDDMPIRADLVARVAKDDPDAPFDPDDSDTYVEEPIEVGDTDCTGMCLPEALHALLAPHGFGFCFRLGETEEGDPEWRLEFYRLDSMKPRKVVYLRPAGEPLDPARTNVSDLSLQRDGDVANEWSALCERVRYEADFVLAPKDLPTAEDKTIATPEEIAAFHVGSPGFDGRFREWVFDEDGQGHIEWDKGTKQWSVETGLGTLGGAKPASLKRLFDDGTDLFDGTYSLRPRPGSAQLDRKDPLTNEYVRAKLWVTTDLENVVAPDSAEADQAGSQPVPGLLGDTFGRVWQEITSGGWELLENRLGIRITAPDLDDWNIGEPPADLDNAPVPGGVLRVRKATVDPAADAPAFLLRLTTVIEGDRTIAQEEGTEARRRDISPIERPVRRLDDLRNRLRATATWDNGELKAVRTDVAAQAEKLHAHLVTRRVKHETPALTGSITIPRCTYGYRVGDRIARVSGRGLSLAQSVPADSDAPEVLPSVLAITRTFDNRIATTLTLGDRRADARPVAKRYR